jgi:hypothetical protein
MTNAVRHCMECRFQRFDISRTSTVTSTTKSIMKDPLESILQLNDMMNVDDDNERTFDMDDVTSIIATFIQNPESVLQELDIQRLRAIIYRDVVRPDRNRTGKNVVVVVVNVIFFRFSSSCYCMVCYAVNTQLI